MKNYKLLFALFFESFLLSSFTNAQTISQDVIGSAGSSYLNQEGSFAWTIGEVTVDTYLNSSNFLTQGFHQPGEKGIEINLSFFIPEGFSPNNDLINDVFFIRGLSNYPNNSLTIYSRWGTKVFEASPYLNNWDGKTKLGVTFGNDVLPVGTYFYLFDYGNESKILKGAIYLNV